ncbi:hypothetical protein GCM10009845_35210 [Pedococcus bigeumensis]
MVKVDARTFADEHEAVKKLVAMRGAAPDKAEPTYGPYARGLLGSLHVSSARAVTTWIPSDDVCWLLGYNDYHRNGEPDDAYAVFNGQYEDGVLMPTQEDWEAFFEEPVDRFLDMLRETGQRLLEAARANPGHEEFETFDDGGHQVICVDILVLGDGRAEEGWMGLTLPADEVLSDMEVFEMVATLIPEGAVPIYEHKFKDRERRRGEIVYRWEHYEFGRNDDEH